ncbi:MAG: GAF domain-containing protein, partial [Gimesia chilikensis]
MQQTSDALPDIKLILELISKGSSLNDTLSKLVEYLESKSEDMVCSILLLEENRYLRHGAAPNLPDEYIEAIDGTEIGPATGSCGTAAYFNQQVVVTDISTDPLWNDYKSYALKHRLCACWSTPIRSSTGDVLGTFAIYYHKPGEPTDYHRHLIEQAVYLAAIAIEHVRIEADLQKSEQESHRLRQHLQEAIESLTEGIVIY